MHIFCYISGLLILMDLSLASAQRLTCYVSEETLAFNAASMGTQDRCFACGTMISYAEPGKPDRVDRECYTDEGICQVFEDVEVESQCCYSNRCNGAVKYHGAIKEILMTSTSIPRPYPVPGLDPALDLNNRYSTPWPSSTKDMQNIYDRVGAPSEVKPNFDQFEREINKFGTDVMRTEDGKRFLDQERNLPNASDDSSEPNSQSQILEAMNTASSYRTTKIATAVTGLVGAIFLRNI